MKKLLSIALLIAAATASAATLSPVSLLNPAGSTAGQAIVSTGPSSPPGWATVVAGALAPVDPNSVIANATASAASPTAFAMPSCSGPNSALLWTSNSGFSCGSNRALTTGNLSQFAATTSAQLAGVLSDETGTGGAVFSASPALSGTPTAPTAAANTNTTQIATTAFVEGEFASPPATGFGSTTPRPVAATTITATGAITPSQTAGIVGTTTNNNAAAGAVGEYVSVTGSAVAMTTGTVVNCASTTLTPGDWDVNGAIFFSPGGTTTIQGIEGGLTTTSATMPASPQYTSLNLAFTAGAGQNISVPTIRVSVAANTTVYLVGRATFGTSTMNCVARITARRAR